MISFPITIVVIHAPKLQNSTQQQKKYRQKFSFIGLYTLNNNKAGFTNEANPAFERIFELRKLHKSSQKDFFSRAYGFVLETETKCAEQLTAVVIDFS